MIILGIASPFVHDPSAAILVDGELIAAADEERFTRDKHARGKTPVNAVNFCLKTAGIRPEDVDYVAYPWSEAEYLKKLPAYVMRTWRTRPSRAFKSIYQTPRTFNLKRKKLYDTLRACGINIDTSRIGFVGHHIAHVASSYYLSGFKEAALMSMDGTGEFTATLFGEGKGRDIKIIKEFIEPDSIGRFYSTVTAYLGFKVHNGEYKVMGMAPYGDPNKINMDKILTYNKNGYRANDDYVWVNRSKRYDKERVFSKKMVSDWGPPRAGDGLSEPYVHIAAATQKRFEDVTLSLMERYLGEQLKRHRTLCFAGGCALNVSLNRKILDHPLVERLFVQPSAHDSGAALGAAAYMASRLGEDVKPMKHAYYGPSYTNDEIKTLLDKYRIRYRHQTDITEVTAQLLSEGKIVAWFQGAMEYGPRALGNRSILAHPSIPGISDEINGRIKFRENWRPFCPSVLPEYQKEIFGTEHPSGYMTFSFIVNPAWRSRIKEAVHIDGSARPQVVDENTNPLFYGLLKRFHKKTEIPVLINTSLNRRGEPMVCSPQDAIDMFYGSGLEYMVMGDYLISKR
ncbi:MAG: carbamoyltransferase [Candidatus Omnitrophica bacterium]|nr:carbamoyltransferase [Candidatus Omnitrophota bacterium]